MESKAFQAILGMKHIDPHVHCRDWDESKKATIREVMLLARSQNVVAICDMPNTRPAVTTAKLVERRLETARSEDAFDGYYTYIGATRDPNQISEAARVAKENPRVVGIKLYAGKSVGNLAVTEVEDQEMVYKVLAKERYTGILAVHCEHEQFSQPHKWNPAFPETWNLAKPPKMEIAGVRNQTRFALKNDFMGHLHICHVSMPQTVELVSEVRGKMRISCGVTPHHLSYSTNEMHSKEGIALKVNPPIRETGTSLMMVNLLRSGEIDLIETDHAPHLKEEKTYSAGKPADFFMSGIRSLEGYSQFLQNLILYGLTARQISNLTYWNIKKIFTKVEE